MLVVLRDPWLLVVVGILAKLRLVSPRCAEEPKWRESSSFGVVDGESFLFPSTGGGVIQRDGTPISTTGGEAPPELAWDA
jgi:hypothetical protein